MYLKRKISLLTFLVLLIISCDINGKSSEDIGKEIKLGYFHGGKNYGFFRAYVYKYFDKNGVNVSLYTTVQDKGPLTLIEKDPEWIFKKKKEQKFFGKMTGNKIAELINEGKLDGGLIGSGSFLDALEKNLSIVAVASLGMCDKEKTCRSLTLREGVKIINLEDLRGKKICYFKDTSIDYLALVKYLKKVGLYGNVTLIETKDWDSWVSYAYGKADACIRHYGSAKEADIEWNGHYEAVDWINPNMDHGLLVFKADFIHKHPDKIKKIILGYNERLNYEKNLSDDEAHKSNIKGLNIKDEYEDISLAVMNYNLSVKTSLLNEIETMMMEEDMLERDLNIQGHVDNSFVSEIIQESK